MRRSAASAEAHRNQSRRHQHVRSRCRHRRHPRRVPVLGRARTPRHRLALSRRIPRPPPQSQNRSPRRPHRRRHRAHRRHHHGPRPRPALRPHPRLLPRRRHRRHRSRRWALSPLPSGPTTIVDGDLAHEIDAREIPKDWKTGYVPLGKSTPYEQPRTARFGDDGNVYHLNTALVDWAFNLTKDTELPDTPQMKERRAMYAETAAHRPPFVLRARQSLRLHLLARQAPQPVGPRLGQIPDRRPRHLRRLRHGGHRHPAVPHLARQRKQTRHPPRPRPPHRLQLRPATSPASPRPKASPRPRSANTAPTCPRSTTPTASATSSSTTSSRTGPKPATTSPQNKHPPPSNARPHAYHSPGQGTQVTK